MKYYGSGTIMDTIFNFLSLGAWGRKFDELVKSLAKEEEEAKQSKILDELYQMKVKLYYALFFIILAAIGFTIWREFPKIGNWIF